MRREWAGTHDEAANHQLPIAAAFWIIQIVFTKECSSLMQNLMQICCSICSVILNALATLYTYSFNNVYCSHWLVQWSLPCSPMHIPVHSLWLPGYIDVVQTILIILTMAGPFLDRPYMSKENQSTNLKRYMHPHVHCSVICTITKLWKQPKCSPADEMDKKVVVHI